MRLTNEAEDSMISESNLSDVCQVEEFDLNKDRSTEKILDQLNVTGNPMICLGLHHAGVPAQLGNRLPVRLHNDPGGLHVTESRRP